MENCTFCGYAITPGTGKMYVKKDARILYFCSRRCEKNMLKLGRNPRKVTFTAEAKKSKKQQMAAAAHAAQKRGDEVAGSRKSASAEKEATEEAAPAKPKAPKKAVKKTAKQE